MEIDTYLLTSLLDEQDDSSTSTFEKSDSTVESLSDSSDDTETRSNDKTFGLDSPKTGARNEAVEELFHLLRDDSDDDDSLYK
eukprot:scaffold101088_cov58-Attheya_sp.AAC.1